jgi:hypothetical protein
MSHRLVGQDKTSEWGSTMSRKLESFFLRAAMVWILAVVAYIALFWFILPRLGVPT